MTEPHPRKDPRRRRMRIEGWPERDRAAWKRATQADDPFEGVGDGAHWRPGTRAKVVRSYGRYLTFLLHQGNLDPAAGPADRVVEDWLRDYHRELISQVAPCTVAGLFIDLHEAIRVMVPHQRFPYLTQAMYTLMARARPSRNKRAKYVHPRELFRPVLELLEGVEREHSITPLKRAGRYRDRLMIAMLANWPVRRRNFCAIAIGRHLHKVGEHYQLRFEGEESKNHRFMEGTLAVALTPYIDRYLEVYRPILLKGHASDRLWISIRATEMAEISIYNRVREVTEREFGIALNLHAFRDGPPTALATDDPAHIGAAMPILNHRGSQTYNKHYNQAKQIEAAQLFQENVLEFKRSCARKAEPKSRRGPQRKGRKKVS